MSGILLWWCLAIPAPERKPLPPPETIQIQTSLRVRPWVTITRNGVPCAVEDLRDGDEVTLIVEGHEVVEILIEGKDP